MNRRYVNDVYQRQWQQITPQKPAYLKLARAYVPYQIYVTSYAPQEALEKGTMFPDLYSPYYNEQKNDM